MKKIKLNDFGFGVLVTVSIFICCLCFSFATSDRNADIAIGGEIFTIALPLLIIRWKMWTVEQEKKQQQKRIAQLQQLLKEKTKKEKIFTH